MNKTYDELCQENQMLRKGIRQMTTALANREWADLLTTDGDIGELEIATLQLIEEGQTKDARVRTATLAVEKARTQGQRLAQRLQETSDMLSEALTLGEEASNRCQELQAKNDRLRERDAQVAAEARKQGFIAACVYAAGLLYSWESTGTMEMLNSAVSEDELHLGAEYDLRRLIESKASVPGLHRAWQIARKRERVEIAATAGNCPDGLSCDYSRKGGNCGDPLCQSAGGEA